MRSRTAEIYFGSRPSIAGSLLYPIGSILGAVLVTLLVATALAEVLARRSFPLPPAGRRIGCVDGLRGYLALCVLAHHFIVWVQITRFGQPWSPPDVALFNEFGAGAVALFFMTTGLVFYPRVLDGFSRCDWPATYVSRLFRLLPATALSIALIVGVIALRTGQGPSLADAAPALTWLSTKAEPPLLGYPDSGRLNAYVLWSLHFEWLFYLLVLPACALLSQGLWMIRAPSWLIPVLLGMGSFTASAAFRTPALFAYLPSFAVGMLAYEVYRRPALAARLRGRLASAVAALLLAIGMIVFEAPHGAALLFFGAFFICVAAGNDFGGVLTTPGALVLGECSFSLYLLHGLVLNILFVDFSGLTTLLPTAWLPLLIPAAAVPVVLVSASSFLLVERPAILLGARLARYLKTVRSQLSLSRFRAGL